jgi:excisionase family DNA binding protein
MPADASPLLAEPRQGLTPREVARRFRVSPDRVRAWIHSGELTAINTARARCARRRFIVLPHHLAEFERSRQVSPPTKPAPRRRRQPGAIDYYPDHAGEAVPHG